MNRGGTEDSDRRIAGQAFGPLLGRERMASQEFPELASRTGEYRTGPRMHNHRHRVQTALLVRVFIASGRLFFQPDALRWLTSREYHRTDQRGRKIPAPAFTVFLR
ncbi:hypothetical protein [Nocardia yamanashiensis]|uniref:hypothetical protein n=1 Tax=Nocardia yamanashiensis TaxID=209247 RepID=UPI0012FE26E9|nr:hypothetical protein [Nocardia yamanashiensis]